MRKLFLILLFSLAPATALAQKAQPVVVSNPEPGTDTGLALADLSTSPTSDSILVDQYALLKIQTRFVGGGAATDVGFTCEESDDDTTWSIVTKTAPDGTVTVFHPVYTTGVTLNFTIRLDVTGFVYVRCTYSGTGATGDDKVTMVGRRIRGI